VDWRKFFGLPPKGEQRAITTLPWQPAMLPFNLMPPVNYDSASQSQALSLGAVYSAVRLLAQSVSTLPVKAYRRAGDARVPMSSLPQLFELLVTDGQLVPWLHRCVTSGALRGNAYGYVISRDGFGFPTVIDWLNPQWVVPDDRPDSPNPGGWLVNGRPVPRQDIVHIPFFTLPGERLGMSPIAAYARTLGVGLQAQAYAVDWFGAGGFPPGTFKNTEQTINQEQADIIKARLGSAMATKQPLVYGRDWDYTPVKVPPEEAQFVETMKMTTNQIAAIYGIPPEMIGGESGSSMTYANVEQQQINFVMFTLRPWLVALETAFSALLPDRQYVRFNSDALIRADLMTRWRVNEIRLRVGAANIDEIRAQEDQPPLPNGQGSEYKTETTTPAIEPAASPDEDDDAPSRPLRRVQ
jgi:HK97 family phage portal protein